MRSVVPIIAVLVLAGLAPLAAIPGATAPGNPMPSPSAGTADTGETAVSPAGIGDEPEIVAVYPNPVADGDRGEFVVVRFPAPTELSGWALADDEARVPLPNRTVRGTVAFSRAPAAARNLTEVMVVPVDGALALANGGEQLRLVAGNRTVDELRYRDAPEAELYDGNWRPLGATDRPVVHAEGGTARVFVLPDAPGPPVAPLRNASDRILLAGYTFTSERVASALVAAADRGVRVRVLVEGSPVGGTSRRQARLLDRLVEAGVDVRVVAGPYARYDFHHAKYAVADDRAVVLTENWKPSGTGGRSSRGWGAVVDDPAVARALASTFRADAGWRDAVAWREFRDGRTFEPPEPATGEYARRFDPQRVRYERASVLVAPENAEAALLDRLRGADESVRVVQVGIGADGPFEDALVAAARRGVEVRVLLSGVWYTAEESRGLADRLEERADREGLPLAVRLARPRGRFEKIHAKGVVIDGETVVLGSLNWNAHAARENRELLVALESEAAAGYYERVFRADWRGAAWRLPGGLLAAVALGSLACLAVGRRFEFEVGGGG